jgi:hypothetical protein
MKFDNQTFQDQAVELDFNQFVTCTFNNCHLIIRGLSPLGIENCRFDNCNFHFDGPAAMTLSNLQVLYKGMPQVAELALKMIRGEAQVQANQH